MRRRKYILPLSQTATSRYRRERDFKTVVVNLEIEIEIETALVNFEIEIEILKLLS